MKPLTSTPPIYKPPSRSEGVNAPAGTKAGKNDTTKPREAHHMPGWIKYGFPPPEYLRFNFVGLNLSDHSIKVCKSIIDHEHYDIELLDTISLPEGVMKNGEIQNSNEIIKVLRKIKDTYDIDFVRMSIPEERAYLAIVTIPPTDEDKLRSVIEFHIGDHIPLSVDEIQFDFDVLSRNPQSKKITTVVVIAIAKTIVQEITTILDHAKLTPLSMEVEAQAIARVVTPPGSQKTYLALDLGRSRTGLSIIKNGIVYYTTTIDFGGDDLVQKISELRNIDFAGAEAVKRESGLDWSQYSSAEQKVLTATVQSLLTEIAKRQNFWDNQGHGAVEEVLIVGGNASTPQLTSYLQEKIGKPVRIPDVWQNVFAPGYQQTPVSDNEALGYAAVVGLAINEDK